LADQAIRATGAERVTETVKRALLLVGPPEHGVERLDDEQPVEDPAL
jgi:hypothetical protein